MHANLQASTPTQHVLTVRDVPQDMRLITDSQDIEECAQRLALDYVAGFGCLFVRMSEHGEYNVVYGCYTSTPYLSSVVERVL